LTKIKKIKTWSSSKIDLEGLHVFIFLILVKFFKICVFFTLGLTFYYSANRKIVGKQKNQFYRRDSCNSSNERSFYTD